MHILSCGVSCRCQVTSRADSRHAHDGRAQGQLQGPKSSMALLAAVGSLVVHSYDCRVSPHVHAFQWRQVSEIGLGACRCIAGLTGYR